MLYPSQVNHSGIYMVYISLTKLITQEIYIYIFFFSQLTGEINLWNGIFNAKYLTRNLNISLA